MWFSFTVTTVTTTSMTSRVNVIVSCKITGWALGFCTSGFFKLSLLPPPPPSSRERSLTAHTVISVEVPQSPEEEETRPMSVMSSSHDLHSCHLDDAWRGNQITATTVVGTLGRTADVDSDFVFWFHREEKTDLLSRRWTLELHRTTTWFQEKKNKSESSRIAVFLLAGPGRSTLTDSLPRPC